jgi:NAD(P)-dependent dehydrogenase (short-subunit alcohol dehydrogenase family)
MEKLKDKVAIITGGASGMGRSTAILFADNGAKVVVADIDAKGGEETVRSVKDRGGEAVFILTDVSKSSDVQNMVRKSVERYGKLNILCNCAGIAAVGTVLDTSEELWSKVMDINLKSTFLGMKYAIPEMIKAGGGSIINWASVNGLYALTNEAAYDASKGGVVMLSKATALDFGSNNIRVNAICPGIVDTPLVRNLAKNYPEVNLDELGRMNAAIKRLLKPDEIANMALFLASDESSGLTGAAYVVDGGYTAI